MVGVGVGMSNSHAVLREPMHSHPCGANEAVISSNNTLIDIPLTPVGQNDHDGLARELGLIGSTEQEIEFVRPLRRDEEVAGGSVFIRRCPPSLIDGLNCRNSTVAFCIRDRNACRQHVGAGHPL
jgi:hypothetical protein